MKMVNLMPAAGVSPTSNIVALSRRTRWPETASVLVEAIGVLEEDVWVLRQSSTVTHVGSGHQGIIPYAPQRVLFALYPDGMLLCADRARRRHDPVLDVDDLFAGELHMEAV